MAGKLAYNIPRFRRRITHGEAAGIGDGIMNSLVFAGKIAALGWAQDPTLSADIAVALNNSKCSNMLSNRRY